MIDIVEGDLTFHFSEGIDVIKFDDTVFYREKFSRVSNNIKAVDIIAVDNKKVYFIEIKDYRHPDTKNVKQCDLITAIINKVIFSLSAILPMKNNANKKTEKEIARKISIANEIRVIFHIELPPPRRTLSQSNFNLQNFEFKLKNKLKAIASNTKLTTNKNAPSLPWDIS